MFGLSKRSVCRPSLWLSRHDSQPQKKDGAISTDAPIVPSALLWLHDDWRKALIHKTAAFKKTWATHRRNHRKMPQIQQAK
jgi:hypothetical protein